MDGLEFTALPCARTHTHTLTFIHIPPHSIANGQKRKILQAANPQREGIKDIEQGGRSSGECTEKDKAKEWKENGDCHHGYRCHGG